MANVVAVIPETDTTGSIRYDSDVPYLGIDIYTKASDTSGTTIYADLKTKEKFVYDLYGTPPSNDLLVLGLTNLSPNTETTFYAVPVSGLTYANFVISSQSLLYVTDDFVRFAAGETPPSVSATPRLPTSLSNVKYNKGTYYACGESPNFGFSDNGVFWNTDAHNPYLNKINDIAFDSKGMGVAVGSGNYCMSVLFDNKVWMPVLGSNELFTDDKGTYEPKLVINAKRWYAVSDKGLFQSYNGITWSNITSTLSGLTFPDSTSVNLSNPISPVAADYDASTDLLIIATADYLIKIQAGVVGLIAKASTYFGTGPVITDLKFNGKYWLLSSKEGLSGLNTYLAKTTSNALNFTVNITYTGSTSYTGGFGSIAWYDNSWYSLRESGEIMRFSITDGNALIVNDNKPAFTSFIPGENPIILPRVESPYGGALSTDLQPGFTLISELNTIPAQYTYTEKLTFQPVRTNTNIVYCNQEVSYTSPDFLTSFDLTFTTDLYSPKDIVCADILGNEYKFTILESSNDNPYVFSSDSNQSNNAVYDFINDGVLYSNLYNTSKLYSVQIDNLIDIKNFINNPETPKDVDQDIVTNSAAIQDKFYRGFTLVNSNNLFNYNQADIKAVYNFENISNPGVLNGSTAYNYSDLGEALSKSEVSNIAHFNDEFTDFCKNTGSLYYPHPFLDPDLERRFPLAVTNTLYGSTGLTGFSHLDQRLKTEFYDATRSFSTLETYLTTEFIENNHTSQNYTDFKNAFKLFYDDTEINRLRNVLDSYKKPVNNKPKYTEKTRFRVLFDGQLLSYYVDNVLIQQFLVNTKLKLSINFDSFNELFRSITPDFYNPVIDFQLINIPSRENSLKELIRQYFNKLNYPKKVNFDYDFVLTSYLNVGASYLPGSGVQTIESPFNQNNYYYLISQYTKDISLSQYCLNNIIQTDPYPGTTGSNLETEYVNNFTSTGGSTGNSIGKCVQNLLLECQNDFIVANTYSAPSPTPNYSFNIYYKQLYDNISNGRHILKTFNLFDFMFVFKSISLLNKYQSIKESLINYPSDISEALPILPSKDLLQMTRQDLLTTFNTSSILTKLGGKLIMNKETIFNGQGIFTNTSNSQTKNFLNAVETLSNTIGDKTLYSRVFSLVTDELGTDAVVNRILKQRLSNLELSLNFLYEMSRPIGIPGYYDSKQYRSNYLVNTIWDNFYGFANAYIKVPAGASLTSLYSLDSSNYVNNYKYVKEGTKLVLGKVEIDAPIHKELTLLGIKFGEPLPTSNLKEINIFDPEFNNTILSYFLDNYQGNFPSSIYDAFRDWMPMNDFLANDVYTGTSYLSILILARLFSNGTLLTQDAYTRDRNSYTALTLPIQSALDDNILQEFNEKFLPEVEGFIMKLFNLDLDNTNYFISKEDDLLFKQYLTVGNYATDYAGITGGSTGYNPNHYVDINRIYTDLSKYYEETVSQSVKTQFNDAGLTNISSLTAYITTFTNNSNPVLLSFKNSLNKLQALSVLYNNSAFKSQFSLWIGSFNNYNNLVDSVKRYKALSDNINSNEPPAITVNPENSVSNFIVSIPPYDTSRWVELEYIPQYRCSRYNPYWRYYENDIVGFNDKVYQCYNTSREYSVRGIPPGGYGQYVGGLNTFSINLNSGSTSIVDGNTGTTIYNWYNYATVTNLQGSASSYASPNDDIESILAWEEWHDVPDEIYPGVEPTYQENGKAYTYNELNYTIPGNTTSFQRITSNWDPERVYYKGDLVFYHNTIYKCVGGILINKGIGKGVPPGFKDTGKSWAIVSGSDIFETPGANGAWTSIVPGVSLLNVDNALDPLDISKKYIANQILPEINHLNPYINVSEYNPSIAYKLGDIVKYYNTIYVCLYNGVISDQSGATGYVTNIYPPSHLTARSDAVWLAQPYIDLSTDGKNIPKFVLQKAYNYGDLVVYNNLVYKFIVKINSTLGVTHISSSTYYRDEYSLVNTTLTGPSGSTFLSGLNSLGGVPPITSSSYGSGGTTSGTFIINGINYSYSAGLTFIPGYTITSVNTYVTGSTAPPPFNKSTVYSKNSLVSYYGDYIFKSLTDNNIDEPPDPSFSYGNNLYWSYVGPTTGPNAVKIPENTTEYSASIDYNLSYHSRTFSDIYVVFDGGLWKWNFTRGIDYSTTDPEFSNLLRYGVVYEVPPPLPTPFNVWNFVNVSNTTLNPIDGTSITTFSLDATYRTNEIVKYKGFHFICTAKGFGSSIIDNLGTQVPTQLYIPEKEVSYGRLINSDTNTRYLETIITSDGVNWKDITKPKWGSGILFDKLGKVGFARDLRYNFASGLELSYITLKHDLSVRDQISFGITNTFLINRIKSQYQFSLNNSLLLSELNTIPSGTGLDDQFKTSEFYYYSNLIKHINESIPVIDTIQRKLVKAYDIWGAVHNTINAETLITIRSNKIAYPSITGEPLFVREQRIDPFRELGFVILGPSRVNNINFVKKTIDTLQNSGIQDGYFAGNRSSVGVSLTTYSNGARAISRTNISDERYWDLLFEAYLETAAFYHKQTGERYYGTGGTGSTLPWIPTDKSNYYYFDIETFENAGKDLSTTIPLSNLIPGWYDLADVVNTLKSGIEHTIASSYSMIGYEMLGPMVDNGIGYNSQTKEIDFGEGNTESLYRQHLFMQTGYDDIIAVPIFTRKDREMLALSLTNGWIGRPRKPYTNNTFIGTKNIDDRSARQPAAEPNYLTERHMFESFPNIFLYNDVRDALVGISGITGTSDLKNNTRIVSAIKNVQLGRLPNGLTGTSNFLNATNYTIWQPWGQIQDNADFSDRIAGQEGYGGPDNFLKSGSVTGRSPQSIFRNTRYERPNKQLKNDEQLFFEQGKHVITRDRWYTCILPYFMHLKMSLYKEESKSLPDSVAQEARQNFTKKCEDVFEKNRRNAIRIVLVAFIAIAFVLLSVATVFTGGVAAVGFVALSIALGVIMTTLSYIPGRPDLALAVSDPGALMIPELGSPQGLATRCAVMDAIAQMVTPQDSTNTSELKQKYETVSYHQYIYAGQYLQDLYTTIIPSLILAKTGSTFDLLNNSPYAKISAAMNGYDENTPEYNSYAASLGFTGTTFMAFNHPEVVDAFSKASQQIFLMDSYEQELFHPKIVGYEKFNRDAIFLVKDVVAINPNGVRTLYSEVIKNNLNYVPPLNVKYKLIIGIIDHGEGFFSYDEDGNKSKYQTELLAGYALTSNITLTNNLEVESKYIYDSVSGTSSSVFGLGRFAHENAETYNEIDVRINNIDPKNIVGIRFNYKPPTYNVLGALIIRPGEESYEEQYNAIPITTYISMHTKLAIDIGTLIDFTRRSVIYTNTTTSNNPFINLLREGYYRVRPSGRPPSILGPAIPPTVETPPIIGTGDVIVYEDNPFSNLNADKPPTQKLPNMELPTPSTRLISSRIIDTPSVEIKPFDLSSQVDFLRKSSDIFNNDPNLRNIVANANANKSFSQVIRDYTVKLRSEVRQILSNSVNLNSKNNLLSSQNQNKILSELDNLSNQFATNPLYQQKASTSNLLDTTNTLDNLKTKLVNSTSNTSQKLQLTNDNNVLNSRLGVAEPDISLKPPPGNVSSKDLRSIFGNLSKSIRPAFEPTHVRVLSKGRNQVLDPQLSFSTDNPLLKGSSSSKLLENTTKTGDLIRETSSARYLATVTKVPRDTVITAEIEARFRTNDPSIKIELRNPVTSPDPNIKIVEIKGTIEINGKTQPFTIIEKTVTTTVETRVSRSSRATPETVPQVNRTVAAGLGERTATGLPPSGEGTQGKAGSYGGESRITRQGSMARGGFNISNGDKTLISKILASYGNKVAEGKKLTHTSVDNIRGSAGSNVAGGTNIEVGRLKFGLQTIEEAVSGVNPMRTTTVTTETKVTYDKLIFFTDEVIPERVAKPVDPPQPPPKVTEPPPLPPRITVPPAPDTVPGGSIRPPPVIDPPPVAISKVKLTVGRVFAALGVAGDVLGVAMAIVQILEILKTKPRAIDCSDIANGRT